jgi:hypothetical protein
MKLLIIVFAFFGLFFCQVSMGENQIDPNCAQSEWDGENSFSRQTCFYTSQTIKKVYEYYKAGKIGLVDEVTRNAWREKLEIGKNLDYEFIYEIGKDAYGDEYKNAFRVVYQWEDLHNVTIRMMGECGEWEYTFKQENDGVEVVLVAYGC